jgi:hypothetical protein
MVREFVHWRGVYTLPEYLTVRRQTVGRCTLSHINCAVASRFYPVLTGVLRQSYFVLTMPPPEQTNCWICRKPLWREDGRLDEFGFLVHKLCHRKLVDEQSSEPPRVIRIKPKPKSN